MILGVTLLSLCSRTEADEQGLSRRPKQRGEIRIVYVSDANSDAKSVLPDTASAAHLRGYVDMLAASGVDVFAQDIFQKQGVGWFWPEHPDHAHFTGQVDKIPREDGPPIKIAIEQCHRRDMKLLATFRMADRHGGGQQGLIARRTDLWNPDFGDAAMDYTHDELREWVFVLLEEILRRFEVDGFEFTYTRWMHCFPRAKARESHPIMTKFLRRVRKKLDETAEKKGRPLLLGVRVPQTLEECHALGYDVPTWIEERLIDYVAPCDFFYTDFNAKYEEFTALARNSKCMVYPAVHPLLCRGDDVGIMRPENYRAAARNMYAAGADGISQFNYQYHWGRRRSNYPWAASGYPTALAWLRQLRGTDQFDALPRHYLFYPLWSAGSPSGFAKNDRIVLTRKVGSRGEYRFRIAEDLGATSAVAELIVRASQSVREDKLVFAINGSAVSPKNIKTIWHAKGRDAKFGRPLPPHRQFMIPLSSPPAVFGDNVLQATVRSLDSHGKEDILIDELEVTVVPPWRRPAR
ncbi:MAG: hypothetical protein CMJ64_12505 [Planctomycetaceae bacterium]|nr:hypothetical protein [Planctomycetaceae bacterium]